MTRKEYLIKQQENGRRILGVFPVQYPKEILWAMDIVPAEIWDPPLEISIANAHLQPSICPIVRQGLELILQGECDFLDGFLFPHTCDSIQNMASVIHDYLKSDKPCYFFYHPKAPYGRASKDYYQKQLRTFVQSLEGQFGLMEEDALRQRIKQGRQVSSLIKGLYDLRAGGELNVSNGEFYRVIRKGEYMFPDDFIPELEGLLSNAGMKKEKSLIPVVLSGVLPNPPELLSFLDDLGVRVAHDDMLMGSRRLLIRPSDLSDPFENLAECYFNMPPCSTRGSSLEERREYILKLIDLSGAKGVIFNIVMFCEPEWFYVPLLKEELKKRAIPSLELDTELNQGFSGQMKTRLEAFIEMID